MPHAQIEYPALSLIARSLDIVFPPVCVGCRRIGRWMCERCWAAIPWLLEYRCFHCSSPPGSIRCNHPSSPDHPIDGLFVAAQFEGVAREAVHALKYAGQHAISPVLAHCIRVSLRDVEADMVVAVPLHARRRRERGYDQAEMLARCLARGTNGTYVERGLKRTRYTTQQTSLDSDRRRDNVRQAFRVRADVQGQAVLLVDDVYTTGATMTEAAAAMKTAGARRVIGAVFARAVI